MYATALTLSAAVFRKTRRLQSFKNSITTARRFLPLRLLPIGRSERLRNWQIKLRAHSSNASAVLVKFASLVVSIARSTFGSTQSVWLLTRFRSHRYARHLNARILTFPAEMLRPEKKS